MKRLLPLLFLVPSVALILYAKRGADPAPDHCDVRVRVDTGAFKFPTGVGLAVSRESAQLSPVEDGWATVRIERTGRVTLRLVITPVPEARTGRALPPIGEPRDFELKSLSDTPSWTLPVSEADCRAAVAAIPR